MRGIAFILDEIHTMNLIVRAKGDILLSKGRKPDITAYLASQRYSVESAAEKID